jgi:hypothetical protein
VKANVPLSFLEVSWSAYWSFGRTRREVGKSKTFGGIRQEKFTATNRKRKVCGKQQKKMHCQRKEWLPAVSANAKRENKLKIKEAEVGRFCYELGVMRGKRRLIEAGNRAAGSR